MIPENAFIGKAQKPAEDELKIQLGVSKEAWDRLIADMAEAGADLREWKSYSPKYGWNLLLKRKKRTILYMGPCHGSFRVSLILGDKAIAAARAGKPSKQLLKMIEEAPRYPEGTGIRLQVKRPADLATVRKLAAIKLAN